MKLNLLKNNYLLSIVIFISSLFFSTFSQAQEYIGDNFMLLDPLDEKDRYCLDLEGYASTTDPTQAVIVHSCKEGWWRDGTYKVDTPSAGNIYSPDFDTCVQADSAEAGTSLRLTECSDSALQVFDFRDDGKVQISSNAAENLCLSAGTESRNAGSNLRREVFLTDCSETDESLSNWIIPREDTEYPGIVRVALTEESAAAAGGMGGAGMGGAGMGAGAMGPGGAMGGGGGARSPYTGACLPCHAENGQGSTPDHAPKISGQHDWYIARQLENFRNDFRGSGEHERWAKQMNFHIKDFTPTTLASFVEHIGTLEDTPATPTITGDVARGESLFGQMCTTCHGADAMGNEQFNAPRLAGMTDWYLVAQLEKFRAGLRGHKPDDNFGAQMAAFAKLLPDDEALNDVVSYINSLAN